MRSDKKKPERFAGLNEKIGWDFRLKLTCDSFNDLIIVEYGRRSSSHLERYGIGTHAISALYHAQANVVGDPSSHSREESVEAVIESLTGVVRFNAEAPEDYLDIWLNQFDHYLETDYDSAAREVLFHARISKALGDKTVVPARGKTFAEAYTSLDEALKGHFEGENATPATSSSNS